MKARTRRRKLELSMQCWAAINWISRDPALRGVPVTELDADIRALLTHVLREYWVLARWRRPFRV
jgi:hypothetical protein